MTIPIQKILYRALTDDGTPTGSMSMIVNGSVTPQEFYIQPPDGEKYVIQRALIMYRDSGAWTAASFGSRAALANGLDLQIKGGDDEVIDLQAGYGGIKSNGDFGALCYDATVETIGAGDSYMHVRWTFAKDAPGGIMLNGHRDERLVMTVNDSLSALAEFHVYVRGYKT